MPSRPDIRDLATNVRDAFADADRDTLLDVLTFVVKEYVVEGPPPMLIHQAETLSDLKNMSFGQLITALQTRFDHPELAMFVVDGEGVGVRVNGVVQPLLARAAAAPAGFIDTRPNAAPPPGVRVVEATLAPRPPAPRPPAPAPAAAPPPAPAPARPAGEAPPPSRGLSIRGRPSGGDAPAAAAPTPTATPAQPPAAAPPPPAAPEKPEGSGDDASARFSLLELD